MRLVVYFAKFVIVIASILQYVGISEHVKFRQAEYAKSLSMSQTNREYLVNNFSLTAGLHPWSLGLEPETDWIVCLNPTTACLCTGKSLCSFHGDFAEASDLTLLRKIRTLLHRKSTKDRYVAGNTRATRCVLRRSTLEKMYQ